MMESVNTNTLTTTMTPSSRYECSHEYVDRPTYLLRNGLYSLRSIIVNGHHRTSSSSSRRGGVGDTNSNFDALPPLVYQLGLLPMGLTSSSSSSGGGDGGQNESEKHRGMRLRRMCLEGTAKEEFCFNGMIMLRLPNNRSSSSPTSIHESWRD